jgi:hypothetical protein
VTVLLQLRHTLEYLESNIQAHFSLSELLLILNRQNSKDVIRSTAITGRGPVRSFGTMGKQKKQRDCEFPSIQDLLHDIAAEQVGEELAGEIAKDGFFQAAEESFIKGPLRSREELISLQEKSVQQLKETLTTSREHATMISRNTLSDLGKPFSPSTPARSMHSLLPIAVRDLTLGITHRGRSLTGRVLGEVGTMRAVMGLLEDAAGEVVRFAVYSHLADVP